MAQYDKHSNYDTVSTKESSSKEFILGAVIGGAIGAATALFLAPKSGTELRQDLNNQAGLLKERSYEWKDQAVTKGNELASTAKEKSAGITQTVQNQSNSLVEKVKSMKEKNSSSDQEETADSGEEGSADLPRNESTVSSIPTVTPVDPATPKTDPAPLSEDTKLNK
ncbi:YtxH domain-containing protein [Jeotgalibacillus proteolyticus]|uniref:YtxH domain-containing protein n=1 Tax=Jeotgalibacillus proteolyticus TaxID=2082395 RepID=UPI003CE814F2